MAMALISPQAQEAGYRCEKYASLPSTNELSLSRGEDRLWIVADQQTKGRGRLGRPWISPPGNLYTSLSFILEPPHVHIPHLSFMAGIMLAQTLENQVPLQLTLKWPNDILYNHAKLAGILVETRPQLDGRLICVIGMGVNCFSSPNDMPYPTTSLKEIGSPLSPQHLLYALSQEIMPWHKDWLSAIPFDDIRARWRGPILYEGNLKTNTNGLIEGCSRSPQR